MDDDDFRALIVLLQGELRGIGAPDIADERHYLRRDAESGEADFTDPRMVLIGMLEAFGRFLAVRDIGTYRTALARLNDTMEGRGPKEALVVSDNPERPVVNLGRAPDLGQVRGDLGRLIGQLLETPPEPRFL